MLVLGFSHTAFADNMCVLSLDSDGPDSLESINYVSYTIPGKAVDLDDMENMEPPKKLAMCKQCIDTLYNKINSTNGKFLYDFEFFKKVDRDTKEGAGPEKIAITKDNLFKIMFNIELEDKGGLKPTGMVIKRMGLGSGSCPTEAHSRFRLDKKKVDLDGDKKKKSAPKSKKSAH